MAVNKVVYNNETLIDLTADTVTSDTLKSGYTAHSASGEVIEGTYQASILDEYLAEPSTTIIDNDNDVITQTFDEGTVVTSFSTEDNVDTITSTITLTDGSIYIRTTTITSNDDKDTIKTTLIKTN
jgi:hypothetical protein